MKKFLSLALIIIFLLSLASCETTEPSSTTPQIVTQTPEPLCQKVEPFGVVPEEFKQIVEENLFNNATAFSDRVLKYTEDTDTYTILMYDLYGNVLAERQIDKLSNRNITTLLATSDGGFLVTVGFRESYLVEAGKWASELGVCSKIIKCDKNGDILWETELEDYEGGTLEYCIEKDGYYYFFGETESHDTNTIGVYSPTDIHVLKLDTDGKSVDSKTIGGSDYDSFYYAKEDNGIFSLYVRSQSKDGNFISSGEWIIELSHDLEILSMEQTDDIYMFAEYLGVINGKSISKMDVENLYGETVRGLDLIIDYGEFYLTVSQNPSELYEKQPMLFSSLLFYWETVYSAYDKDGELIWRATVDSTPNYDYLNDQFKKLPVVNVQ